MSVSLQADSTLPQGYILVNGERVASVSTTGGLSATLADNTVTTSSLVSGSVTTEKIAPGAVVTADLADGAVTPQKLSQPLTLATAKAFNWNGSSSNTFIDFENIPSWVNRVTIHLFEVSTNGTSIMLCRVGSGSIQITNYNSACHQFSNAQSISTTAFTLNSGRGAFSTDSGTIILSRMSGNLWTGIANISVGGSVSSMAGSVTLTGPLDRVRLTTVNGTDVFDAGTINIFYEG